MRIKCFIIEPTDRHSCSLRRYSRNGITCSTGYYHNAMSRIEDRTGSSNASGDLHTHDDPRWPTKCEKCDYIFQPQDEWQLFTSTIYRCDETGEEMTLRDAKPGAMWYATWMEGYKDWCGPDGHCLVVMTPGGEWMIDSRASNCTMPKDNEHKCWVRHGVAPLITVDKNGKTCAAGAGSIMCGSYHGFLRNGHLENC